MTGSFLSFNKDTSLKCEYLVVGSGASGALTAHFLSLLSKDVLIVEEGPYVKPSVESSSINSSFPRAWRNGGLTPIMGNANFVFTEGCCVGGSTMVNSALIHRIPREILREWTEQFQVRGLEFESMQSYHETIENELNVQVIRNSANIANNLFKYGAEKCGFRGMDVPMAAEYENGRLSKRDMQKTFLKKALRNGARIISDCKIRRINISRAEAVSADALYTDMGGNVHTVRITFSKIFLCAGAVHTPLLLRRSGIRKNVGNSIQFHPTVRTVAEFEGPVDAHAVEMPSFQVKEFSPAISLGASVVTPAYTAAGLSVNWETNNIHMKACRNMATYYVMTRSSSKGMVRNLSFLGESYYIWYAINKNELKNLSLGFAKLGQLLFSAGAKRLYPSIEDCPPIEKEKDTDIYLTQNLILKKLNLMTIHAFSSCPMGENASVCTVDSYGKLHGFRNIYLNDASIMPNSPGVNPQGPLMAIALRNLTKNFN